MSSLKEMFKDKDKKNIANLVLVFVLGIVLLMTSGTIFKRNESFTANREDSANAATEPSVTESRTDYAAELEDRLENVLTLVRGAGDVKVMLTLSYGREIIVAENAVIKETETEETDAAGGSRRQYEKNTDGQKIILNEKGGAARPLILKEIEPKIEGVIIVAQGGDDILIKDSLIRASQTVLGVEPHKVQVLKMKDTSIN